MLRLMALRHATAVPHGSMPDHERILTAQGQAEAEAVARYCAQEMLLPDLALVSPSTRTRQTFAAVHAVVPDVAALTIPALYAMQADELLTSLQGLAELAGAELSRKSYTLMLVGHNPACTELAQKLVGFGDRYAFARLRGDFPPAGLAVMDFDIEEWSQMAAGAGRLDRFWIPTSSD
jgi:phosphohistidine phosphatase